MIILRIFACLSLCVSLALAGGPKDVLHIYNWNNALSPDTAKKFEAYCQCHLVEDYYGDNEEMLAKLTAGAKGYDIVFPTSFAMEALIKQNKAQAIDRSKIPHWTNLDPAYLSINQTFDPGNRYGVPIVVTPVMIGFNETKLKELGLNELVSSWRILFDPSVLVKIKGRVTVLDSQRELIAAALMYLGKDVNSLKPEDWKLAKDVILKAKPYWAAFNNQSYIKELTVGNIWVAHGYSNDLFQAIQDASHAKRAFKLNYALQKEGNVLSIDNMVILKNAPRPDLAHRFVNFMLDGKIAAESSNLLGATNPVKTAKNFFAPVVRHNPIINLDARQGKFFSIKDLDAKSRRELNRIWTQIKVSK
jgi:spermidine/putrescine transport system substrate-binding protein